jgi:hypothetical protein
MADGEFLVKLDDEMTRRLQAAAEASGQSVDGFLTGLIADRLEVNRFSEALAALEEYDRTGVSHDAATEMAAFRARVAAKVGRA